MKPFVSIMIRFFPTLILCINISSFVNAEDNVNYSCAGYTTCGDCYSSPYCHWCAFDRACHAYGSWYGCAYGADCESIDECRRMEAEKAGYEPKGIMGLCGLGLFTLALASFIFSSSNRSNDMIDNSQPVLGNETAVSDYSYQKSEIMAGGGQELMQKSFATKDPTFLSKIFGSLTALQLIKAAAAAVSVVMVVVLIPKLPEINICSTEIDWDSIIEGLQDGYFQTSIVSLISIHNPSVYTVTVNTLEATFIHNGMKFGTFSMDPVTIESQSITDDLVTITFVPENTEVVYDLLNAYATGSLAITVDAKIRATFPTLAGSSFNRDINGIYVDLSDDGESDDSESGKVDESGQRLSDRHLCACS